jgi:hypothetical protein
VNEVLSLVSVTDGQHSGQEEQQENGAADDGEYVDNGAYGMTCGLGRDQS